MPRGQFLNPLVERSPIFTRAFLGVLGDSAYDASWAFSHWVELAIHGDTAFDPEHPWGHS